MEYLFMAAVWAFCWALSAGFICASSIYSWPLIALDEYKTSQRFSVFFSLAGPFAIFLVIMLGHFKFGWVMPYSKKSLYLAKKSQEEARAKYN